MSKSRLDVVGMIVLRIQVTDSEQIKGMEKKVTLFLFIIIIIRWSQAEHRQDNISAHPQSRTFTV